MSPHLKAPFPWLGGKRKVAAQVWSALGPVDNYVEPFAGSLAVLLSRPDDRWETGAETVNDADRYLANFWRALSHDPEAVAQHADWPVNECDLLSRHLWLVNSGRERIAKMENDPEYYDAKAAGWWVWGICSWIGTGWCSGNGPHKLDDSGQVVQRNRPHLGGAGRGVERKIPHLGDPGQGVNRTGNSDLLDYFESLAQRLRRVRVCCGDWSRVVTTGALAYGDTVGVFLDPPYDLSIRDRRCYNTDTEGLSHKVREWATANGDNPRYRIVLAGYEDEHAVHMPPGWRAEAWTASRCYGTSTNDESDNCVNRTKERLWFSPHCRQPQPELF